MEGLKFLSENEWQMWKNLGDDRKESHSLTRQGGQPETQKTDGFNFTGRQERLPELGGKRKSLRGLSMCETVSKTSGSHKTEHSDDCSATSLEDLSESSFSKVGSHPE